MTRRTLCVLLCVLLLAASASAEVYPIAYNCVGEDDGYAMLLRDDGTPLTPEDTYHSIYPITPAGTPEAERLYAADPQHPAGGSEALASDDEYAPACVALLDAEGRQLTGFDAVYLRWAAPGKVVFTTLDERCGAMDGRGEVIVPTEYAELTALGDGWLAVDPRGEPVDYGSRYPVVRIDADGSKHDTGLTAFSSSLGTASEGICPINDVAEYDGKGVYVDARGEVLFGRSFDRADSFAGGAAQMRIDGRDGLIDRQGQLIGNRLFEDIYRTESTSGDVFIATDGGDLTVFDADGKALFSRHFDADEIRCWTLNPAMLNVTTRDLRRLFALDGTQLTALPEWMDVSGWYTLGCTELPQRLIEGVGDWPFNAAHLVALDGRQVGGDFQGLSAVRWEDGRGLFITESYRVVPEQGGGYTIGWNSWRYGLCDQDGNALLDCIYEHLEPLSTDRFWVRLGDRSGMIDLDGNWYYAISDYASLMD